MYNINNHWAQNKEEEEKMNSVNKKAIEYMLLELGKFRTELNAMQDQEESEFIDQALDDIEMVMEDLDGAITV